MQIIGITTGGRGVSVDDLAYRNEYYNSKPGRMHDAEAAEEATQGGPVRG